MAADQAVPEVMRDGAAAQEPAGGAGGNRDFAKLWAGETVSLIGTQVTLFAMPLVAILTLNATVLQVGVLNALRFVPVIALSLLAGVWLDRRRRRPVLIACSLGNAALIGLVPIASATGMLSIGLLYLVTTLVGTLNMVFDVGALSYVPDLVERRHLSAANGKLQASTSVAGIAGPGLAGLLIGVLTAPITLSVDAVSYLFSAAGLISIRKPESEPEQPADRVRIRRSIADGLRAVFGSKLLWTMLAQGTALNLFFGAFITVFVVYAVRVLGLSPFELGIVLGAAAVGGLTGALLATRARQAFGLGRIMAITTIGVSAAPLVLLIPRDAGLLSIAVLVAAKLVYGCSVTLFNVNAITLRQVVTPRRLLARMNATYRMLLFGAAPFGAITGGLLGGAVGLRAALVISVIAMATPVIWIFISPLYRFTGMPLRPPDTDADGSPHTGQPAQPGTANADVPEAAQAGQRMDGTDE